LNASSPFFWDTFFFESFPPPPPPPLTLFLFLSFPSLPRLAPNSFARFLGALRGVPHDPLSGPFIYPALQAGALWGSAGNFEYFFPYSFFQRGLGMGYFFFRISVLEKFPFPLRSSSLESGEPVPSCNSGKYRLCSSCFRACPPRLPPFFFPLVGGEEDDRRSSSVDSPLFAHVEEPSRSLVLSLPLSRRFF